MALQARMDELETTILFRCGRGGCGLIFGRLIPVEPYPSHTVQLMPGFAMDREGVVALTRRAQKQWDKAQKGGAIWSASDRRPNGWNPRSGEPIPEPRRKLFGLRGRKTLRVNTDRRDRMLSDAERRFGPIRPDREARVMDPALSPSGPRISLLPETFRIRCPASGCGYINEVSPPPCGPECPCRYLDL